MSDDLCDTLIAWFDQAEDVRIEEANRLTRKDKQKWLTFDGNSDLYARVQKVKYDIPPTNLAGPQVFILLTNQEKYEKEKS